MTENSIITAEKFPKPKLVWIKRKEYVMVQRNHEITKVQPLLDRAAKIDVKFIITDQHQVFGRMTGKAVLDNGKVLEFKDLLCFAEDVHNKY